jgi:hypothetical protein
MTRKGNEHSEGRGRSESKCNDQRDPILGFRRAEQRRLQRRILPLECAKSGKARMSLDYFPEQMNFYFLLHFWKKCIFFAHFCIRTLIRDTSVSSLTVYANHWLSGAQANCNNNDDNDDNK